MFPSKCIFYCRLVVNEVGSSLLVDFDQLKCSFPPVFKHNLSFGLSVAVNSISTKQLENKGFSVEREVS